MRKHGNKKCLVSIDGHPPALHVKLKQLTKFDLVCYNCGEDVDYDEIDAINSKRTRLRSSIRRASR